MTENGSPWANLGQARGSRSYGQSSRSQKKMLPKSSVRPRVRTFVVISVCVLHHHMMSRIRLVFGSNVSIRQLICVESLHYIISKASFHQLKLYLCNYQLSTLLYKKRNSHFNLSWSCKPTLALALEYTVEFVMLPLLLPLTSMWSLSGIKRLPKDYGPMEITSCHNTIKRLC